MSKRGEIIREYISFLREHGLTFEAIADRSGISLRSLHNYEKGKTKNPSPGQLKKIIDCFPEYGFSENGMALAIKKREREVETKNTGRREMEIRAKIVNAERVLRSGTPFAEALSQNIAAFLVGLDLWEKEQNSDPLKIGQEKKT